MKNIKTIKHLFFIDSRVSDYEELIKQLPEDSAWVLLSDNEDGIEQMVSAVAGYSELDSVQIISHGSAGTLYLGDTNLNNQNLTNYTSQLKVIGDALSDTGDLLLYGCNVAKGYVGQLFVEQLAVVTAADVAASDDLTGKNGNWNLEFSNGLVDAVGTSSNAYERNLNVINGTNSNDTLVGDGYDNVIYGFEGNDQIDGDAGDDQIDGGSGDDQIDGNFGNDTIYGGSGNDSLTDSQGFNYLDGGDGLDTLKINVSGVVDISYDSTKFTRTLSGDSSSVTGTFKSFEATTIQGGSGDDQITLTNSQGPYPTHVSGGEGNDSVTLPYTHYTTEYFSLYEVELPDGRKCLKVGSYDSMDVTISDFEILRLNDGWGSQARILSLDASVATQFSEIHGTQWGLDTLSISTGLNMYLWKDAQGVHLGVQGSSTSILVHDIENLNLSAGRLFIQEGVLVTNPYGGQNRYGLNDLEFVTSSEIVQLSNLNASTFAALARLNTDPTGEVILAGTTAQGQTLSATNTLADIDGLGSVSYQWKADGIAISGATNSSFTLTEAQVGKAISVVGSYTDGLGTVESVASSATSAVINVNDAPTGTVSIGVNNGHTTASLTQGDLLSASNTLADIDGLGSVSYQWKADGIAISGATNSSFTLTEAQVGKAISVVGSYTDGHGTVELVASTSTSPVLDFIAPTYQSAVLAADGKTLTLTYNEALGSTTAASSAFTVSAKVGSAAASTATVSNVAINGSTVVLTLANAIAKGATVTLGYKDPTASNDANALQDSAGNDAITISGKSVTNNSNVVIDTTAPVYKSAALGVDGKTLTLTYDSPLSSTTADIGAFTVSAKVGSAAASAATVKSVTVSGSTVVLTLDSAIAKGATVTLGYKDPSASNDANAIQDIAGNDAITISGKSVTNGSTVVIDTTAPVYKSAALAADGKTLTLTYDSPLSSTTAESSAFTVSAKVGSAAASPATVKSVTVSGSTVVLTLDSAIAKGATVTLGYKDPTANNDANAIQDIAGNDAITISGKSVTNGSTVVAPINGNDSNNTLTGTANADVINGLGGNDTLTGAGAVDTMNGGNDSDLYIIAATADHSAAEIGDSGASGTDEVRITATAASTFTLYAGDTGIETVVIGTGTAATAVSTATTALNVNAAAVLNGLTITGNAGANILTGTAYNDNIMGNAGNDTISAGAGIDTINGGLGADSLTGGAGKDTFVFAAGASGQATGKIDVITDLAKGAVGTGDLIDTSANLTIGGSNAATTSAQALINATTGIATFAAASGTTLADALADIASRFTAATNSAGEFALFRVNNTGNYYAFISDGTAGVTANDVVIQLTGVTTIGSIDLTGGNLTLLS